MRFLSAIPAPIGMGVSKKCSMLPLGPFSLEEMVDYINVNKRSILATQVADSDEMKALYERTEGRPILIGLVTDIVNNRVLTLEELLHVSPGSI